jgi:uncharacterized protein (TIGR00288 family)
VVFVFGIRKGKNIALFVDGPNIIRKEFGIDLDELRKILEKHGRIMIGKVFLNQYASEKLIEAVANQGFEPSIFLAGEEESDVDVALAVSVVKAAYSDKVDIIAIASRDADYLPAIQIAKEKGKRVIVIGINPGFSKALQNAADTVEILTSNKKK